MTTNINNFDPEQKEFFGHFGVGNDLYKPAHWPEPPSKETDPNGKDLNSPGAKADSGKIRPWLMLSGFAHALEEVSKVTSLGAVKYTPNGWVSVDDASNRYMDAFMRHALKLGQGQKYDTDPGGLGTHHMAQMIWNLLAVLELELRSDKK